MRIIMDGHLHSRFSRATSSSMNLEQLSRNAKVKGLNLLGTGDFTHPEWWRELAEKLQPLEDSGFYEFGGILWLLSAEVATVFNSGGRARRVHHVLHAPSLEVANQISETLTPYGNLSADGRPMLGGLGAPELVELLMEISREVMIYPAHAYTPWESIFGSFSGFDHIEDCYQDQTKNIYAIETGLSSDPAMSRRISWLDRFALLSNSDAHSPHPWRIGREANVFELRKPTYKELTSAIRDRDPARFLYTIEVPPPLGKYHYTGHRDCGVSLNPVEAVGAGNLCPKCGRRLTVGVGQRIEELADRAECSTLKGGIPSKTLLPLYELIAHALGVGQHYSRRVLEEYEKLVARFGSELEVLLNVPEEELAKSASKPLTQLIIRNRFGKIGVKPGYDGVYGEIIKS